jgi:hypothetical protein
MLSTSLPLSQILQLEAEVNGVVNPQTGEVLSKGLLKETLKFKTKYWLMQLSEESLANERKRVDTLRESFIKELGEEGKDGNVSIPMYINVVLDEKGEEISKDVNPKFIEFQEKFTELLNETKEITHGKFLLEDFELVESAEVYPVFFKLISKE